MKPKYFYKNEPAIDYCKKHPEYKYNHLTKYISEETSKNPSRDTQEIIDEFFETNHKRYTRVLINGMTLRSTCFYLGISYYAVLQELCRSRKAHPKMDEFERVSMVLDKFLFGNIQELEINDNKELVLKLNNKKEN